MDKSNVKSQLELDAEEFKLVMLFRYKEQIDAHQSTLARAIMLCQGRETLNCEQVRTLASAAQALDELYVKCGCIAPQTDEDAEDVEDAEDAEDAEEA